MKEKKFDKRMFKKEGDELQAYFHFKKRGGAPRIKKGKGSKYSRKIKHKGSEE